MISTIFQRLLDFLDQLEEARDGSTEVEWFRRDEGVNAVEAAWLDTFIAEQRD
jgi:hypothetical protein